MKIVTWNVNGIRSFDGKWKEVMESFDADIICVQETKVTSKFRMSAIFDLQDLFNVHTYLSLLGS